MNYKAFNEFANVSGLKNPELSEKWMRFKLEQAHKLEGTYNFGDYRQIKNYDTLQNNNNGNGQKQGKV